MKQEVESIRFAELKNTTATTIKKNATSLAEADKKKKTPTQAKSQTKQAAPGDAKPAAGAKPAKAAKPVDVTDPKKLSKVKPKFSEPFEYSSEKDKTMKVYVSTQKARGDGYIARISK